MEFKYNVIFGSDNFKRRENSSEKKIQTKKNDFKMNCLRKKVKRILFTDILNEFPSISQILLPSEKNSEINGMFFDDICRERKTATKITGLLEFGKKF